MTVQPTEQCVQIFLRMVIGAAPGSTGRSSRGVRLAHAGERHSANRCKATGDKTGAAQEGAAVDAAGGMI